MSAMNRGIHKSMIKRVLAYACMALAVAFTLFAFVAKYNRWPGANLALILIPVWVMLFVAGIAILRSINKRHTATDSTLLVDYRLRYLIGKTMKTKRRVAWMMLVVGIVAVICVPVRLLFFENYEFPLVFVLLPAAVAFLAIGLVTIKTSRKVDEALNADDQNIFNHAMARWAFRCRLVNWCYLLFPVATILLLIMSGSIF